MRLRRVQLFFAAALSFSFAFSVLAEPVIGRTYAVRLVDVDGNTLSTSDGHITVIAFCKVADLDKARAVGDRIPQYCVGNPAYRFITLVAFQKRPGRVRRSISVMMARRRLDAEAKRLQPRYSAKKLTRDPGRDVFAALDFDGNAAAALGIAAGSSEFQVLVLDGKGTSLQQWTNVPGADELSAVLSKR
jgi:hypothetical protein